VDDSGPDPARCITDDGNIAWHGDFGDRTHRGDGSRVVDDDDAVVRRSVTTGPNVAAEHEPARRGGDRAHEGQCLTSMMSRRGDESRSTRKSRLCLRPIPKETTPSNSPVFLIWRISG